MLSLEDLARMVERGIYDLSTWVAGMQFLPGKSSPPECFQVLQFTERPKSKDEVAKRYKQLVKAAHPDGGGSAERFCALEQAYQQALEIL